MQMISAEEFYPEEENEDNAAAADVGQIFAIITFLTSNLSFTFFHRYFRIELLVTGVFL